MKQMTPTAVERAMKLQGVMLRAMAKRITWYQAAEILGISCRQMQRWHTRFEHEGYEGLFDSLAQWWISSKRAGVTASRPICMCSLVPQRMSLIGKSHAPVAKLPNTPRSTTAGLTATASPFTHSDTPT